MTEIIDMKIPKKFHKHLGDLDRYISYYEAAKKTPPERAVVDSAFYQAIEKSFGKQVPARITRQGIPVVTQ